MLVLLLTELETYGQAEFVYQSEQLQIERLTQHTFRHVSYYNSNEYGRVACNGMIIANNKEAVIFDTPVEESASLELMQWIEDSIDCQVKAIVPTHFHFDCLGTLGVFHDYGIPSYANHHTIELARRTRQPFIPEFGFHHRLSLAIDTDSVLVEFAGEGHTLDNVVAYFPRDQVLFGGCLIKSIGAGEGNLEDANLDAWPATMKTLLVRYPEVAVVIPGHGKPGGQELLNYTIDLFKKEK